MTYLLRIEKEDYQRRATAAATGRSVPRAPAILDNAMVQYEAHILSSELARTLSSGFWKQRFPKAWGGDPIACILKLMHGSMLPAKRMVEYAFPGCAVQIGLSEQHRNLLTEPANAWSLEDSPLSSADQDPEARSSAEEEGPRSQGPPAEDKHHGAHGPGGGTGEGSGGGGARGTYSKAGSGMSDEGELLDSTNASDPETVQDWEEPR